MEVYELKLKIYLLKDINQLDALNQIATFIDEVLSQDQILLRLHKENQYKPYSFCNYFPISEKGIYKKDAIYSIIIRTVKPDLGMFFATKLSAHSNNVMKGLRCEVKIVPKYFIEKVYSLTPILLKDSQGYWKQHLSFEQFEERLKVNLIKKYNFFTNTKINEDFPLYHVIRLMNRTPIKIPYKGVFLLGDKVELQVSDHPLAQQLIYMSLGTGLCESNARGCGFLHYQYYK